MDDDFIEIEHTADESFRVHGRDLRELFENAARSMFRLQSATAAPATITRRVCLDAGDRETLLVDWLNEILYLQEVHAETYHDCKIENLSETSLQAEVMGGPRRGVCKLIKAVTFHNLSIEPAADGLWATIVVDV